MASLRKHPGGNRWGLFVRPNDWYAVTFVGVMGVCAGLVILLESLGFNASFLGIAVLVGALFHTMMSIEGLMATTEVVATSEAGKARLRKVELLAGAIGGVIDIAALILVFLVGSRLDGGVVVNIILFGSGLLLPPALGIAAGFPLARKILGKR